MSVEKATSYLERKGADAKYCADKFPIQERVIPGATTVIYDTLTVEGDSVECKPSAVPTKVKCPDVKTIVQHTSRVDTLVQENTAKVEMYKQKYFEEQAAHVQTKGELKATAAELAEVKKYRLWFFIAVGTGIFVLLWPVLRRFLPVPF